MPRRSRTAGEQVRLKAADPFELIRWLARSQSDPRKAVAELVQNSLDAGARHIEVIRRRVRGAACLVVIDDGEGVIPELERREALHYLSTHVGHSRKLGLTPAERHDKIIAGQYGVGLLGFWCLGHQLEMRTRVAGSELLALRLTENRPTAAIERLPPQLDAPPTLTEVWVLELHPTALRVLTGRRLADYLAAELRGQLLAREVELTIDDRLARGTGQKRFQVRPRRFVGEALHLPAQVAVPGYAAMRVELHVADADGPPSIQLAAAGTLVADDMADLAPLGVEGSPWSGRGLCGIIDFPDLSVPPGTRRGVIPDAAALAFVEALRALAPAVEAELGRLQIERSAALDRQVIRELRRALRGFGRRLPQYELPEAADGREGGAAGTGSDGEPPAAGGDGGSGAAGAGAAAPTLELFPPGPLANVAVVPAPVQVPVGGEHRVQARATDADGRTVSDGLTFAWRLEGPGLQLRGEGVRPALAADVDARPHQAGRLTLVARQGEREARAEVPVEVVPELENKAGGGLGVPEPLLVREPGLPWRSRMIGDRWEVNEGHEDYVAVRAEPRARLRYLLALLAKELVYRSYGNPGDDALLERMAEILAHAERNLRGR